VTSDGYHRVLGKRIWVSQRGDGPPLLLLMGIGGNTAMWRPADRRLAGFRTIAFDMPGTGRSPLTCAFPTGMSALADLAAGVLDSLGVEQAHVLGYSFGGAVAQELAHRHPRRVERLVLVATTFGVGAKPGSPLAMASLMTPLRYYSPRFLRMVAPFTFGGDSSPSDEELLDRRQRPPNVFGYMQQLGAIGTWTSLPWLASLAQPTLVVMGADDPLAPLANGRYMAARIPRAQLVVVPGAGHLLLLEGDERAYGAIEHFLTLRSLEDTVPAEVN
jgi:pimeloyl-ACP methyl ester carboxylesterase